MKNFNREAIQRMFDGRKGGGGGGTNNADLAGYATQMWVNQNYVSIEFFNRLFSIHGHDPEDESTPPTDISVLPNDMDSIVDSIESMVGFWTEEYLSALGQNDDQGGGGITLNAALASINNSPLGNPTGTNTVLMFNGTTWVYASMGSTDMNTVWTALAAATNQQINISHLATALSGYATTSQLSDYATVTDLEQLASYFNTLSGYFTNGAANEAVKLETARTIWGQQFDGTANITGDITQATCLEFSGIAGTATNGGFIDFHYAGGGADYTSRIIEDVSGVLKINNTIWAQLSGNVSIGTSTISQTYKLDVAGYTKTTRLYLADGVYLEYDSTNSGVHLVGAGFYSDSYVSALGVNSGGGGGGSDYIPLTGSSSITGTLAPSVATADLGSSTNKWRNIYGTSLSISNTLTTYALTVNSSATVAGSITATNGNLVASTGYVSSAGGYKVTGSDNTSVLLAGGGTKPLSEIGSAYTLPAATAAALGGLKVNQSYGQAATVQASGNTGTRNYGLQIDSNGMGFVYVPWENTDNDTKNTAGATNLTATKMYLVGATGQSANPQTYTNSNCYIGTDNYLHSYALCFGPNSLISKGSSITSSLSDVDIAIHAYNGTTGAYTKIYSYCSIFKVLYGKIGVHSDQWGNQLVLNRYNASGTWGASIVFTSDDVFQGAISMESNDLYVSDDGVTRYKVATQSWVTSQGYLTSGDVVTVVGAQNITGAKTFTATLTSSAGGSFTGGLRFYSLCVECASDGTPSSSRYGEINRYNNTLHLQYDSGTGGVTMCQQGFTFTNTGSTRSITINASLQLTCGSGTPYTDKNWVYNSDMRKKDVIRLIDMDAQRIADAPIFDFTWKSDAVKELTLGSSAQYWQKVFPNAVRTTPDGYLGMDYSSIALASAVLTARKVVDHEARIRLLEVENAALRNEINQLKKVA